MYNQDSDKNRALKTVEDILRASQNEREPYEIGMLGRDFIVLPGVFSPRFFDDSEFFARHVEVPAGGRFLEIGPGIGAVCVLTALKGAGEVVAVDINADAVTNTSLNACRHQVDDKVTALVGDVYTGLPPDKRFDLIYWNLPFGLTSRQEISVLERSIMDPGYEAIRRFFKEASIWLAPEGKLIFGFSPTVGYFNMLQDFMAQSGLSFELLAQTQAGEGSELITFQIFVAVLEKAPLE
jgi:release factor glutamine methyltransferase